VPRSETGEEISHRCYDIRAKFEGLWSSHHDTLAVFRHHDATAESGGDEIREADGDSRAPVNDGDLLQAARHVPEPIEQFVLIGVAREAVDLFDLNRDRMRGTKQAHLARAL